MAGEETEAVTCNVCGMFKVLPVGSSHYACRKCKLVAFLEKIQGLEEGLSTLHCVREDKEFIDMTHDAFLRVQQNEGKISRHPACKEDSD